MTRCETTDQSDQILATRSDFVPTAFDKVELETLPPEVDWKSAMKRAIRCSVQLRQALGLPTDSEDWQDSGKGSEDKKGPGKKGPGKKGSGDKGSEGSGDRHESGKGKQRIKAEESFPTFVPLEFLARIRPGDPDDPLLRQVLPIANEDIDAQGFSTDPVGDLNSLAAQGLLHKYEGRALLITSGACGVHCRYCFRREYPYSSSSNALTQSWQPSLDYLRERTDIHEVLLSGGDPLTLSDSKLAKLINQIETFDHVKRLRIHSRMPIVIPQRVTRDLVDHLVSSRLAVWFVVHVNHPNELDEGVLKRLGMLIDAGIPVLNQAVLLRGVNDRPEILKELCLKLVDHRIQPYYLHQLDRVRGATHFEVPIDEGKRLVEQLRASLPGYAVPTYVSEQPGAPSKTPLS